MRVAVVGAGAIGGFLACKLFAAGHDVSVVARGATLEAIRENGLKLYTGDDVLLFVCGLHPRPASLALKTW